MNKITQVHIIKRINLIIEVDVDEEFAFKLRNMMEMSVQKDLLHWFEETFNNVVPPDEWVIIDRIEVDEGDFAAGEIEKAWIVKFKKQFKEILLNKMRNISASERKIIKTGSDVEAIIFFLEKGYWPWWYQITAPSPQDILMELILNHKNAIAAALMKLSNPPFAIQRLVFQFNDSCIIALCTLFGVSQVIIERFIIPLLATTSNLQTVPPGRVIDHFKKNQLISRILQQFIEGNQITDMFTVQEYINLNMTGNATDLLSDNKFAFTDTGNNKKISEPDRDERIITQQAGLVIIAPYLPILFKNMGLLNQQNIFISPEDQEYAVFFCIIWYVNNVRLQNLYLYWKNYFAALRYINPYPQV